MPKIESYTQGTPSYVELMTPDQQAAKAFYGALFGWDVQDVPLDDQGNVYLAAEKDGDSVAGISGQMPELAGHPAFWGVYLTVDDVDATAAKVADAGGKVEAGPFDVMDLGRMASIQDPTGARVNLWQAGATIGTIRANEPGTPIWNELVSPDLETATKFYADVLGVEWQAQDMPGGSYTTLVSGGRPVGGAMLPPMEGIPPHWNVYFNVTSVDETVAQAESLGGQVVAPAFDVPGVGRMAVLSDPQGAMFNLMQNPSED
ncbi:VOC family protein [Nocardioides sp. LS1]|uniref:VOC family protein n=1 Tax=Nocardioides sp. LS1 TaxID=1027620 RepID=UPI000FFAFA91|nr:VOC family protein [Nocardioides sp. LS1]GCD90066.1 putative glyoxylase CFP32 [Nocardioides sp. LS1]